MRPTKKAAYFKYNARLIYQVFVGDLFNMCPKSAPPPIAVEGRKHPDGCYRAHQQKSCRASCTNP
jgi:hypothetical protein